MKVAAIVWANLLRASRDRTALFFSVLLPIALILVLGLTYGSQGSARVGLVDADGGTLANRLVDDIAAVPDVRIDIRRYDSIDGLRDAASRGIVEVGVAIPAGYGADLAAGRTVSVTVVSPSTGASGAVRSTVERAIASQVAIYRAARFAVAVVGAAPAAAVDAAQAAAATVPGVAVRVEAVNAPSDSSASGYSLGAQGQVILFMFLTSLTGAVELVVTRQLGVSRRMFATPTGTWTIVTGEALARIAFALLQGLFIVFASALLFGVRWGDPVGVALVVVMFALVAGGAAMIVGALAANPSQAGALGPALGLLLGLFGGTMVPPEVFPETMRTLSRLTPHAWAMDALRTLGEAGAGAGRVLPDVAVLACFAIVFFGIAVVRFRRVLQGGG